MLPYYSKEVYVDASLMDGGDFSLVDPDGDYVIDEDCVRYCVYATVNDSAVYLKQGYRVQVSVAMLLF